MDLIDHQEINNQLHTEEMQDIIAAPPAWLLRWGIMVLLGMLILMVALSAFIYYPDTVKTQMRITSLNSPKPITTKLSGKLVKLLVKDGAIVKNEQPLAYLESTANHDQVLKLLANCTSIENKIYSAKVFADPDFSASTNLQLGELQDSYQIFYE